MPHEEIKRPADSLPSAGKGRVIVFVNESGIPSLKNENGTVTPSLALQGTPVPVDEQVSDPTPVADRGFYYAKEGASGRSEAFYEDDGGQVVQLTDDGKINAKGLFFDGSVKLSGQVFWAGASSSNLLAAIPIPVGTNIVVSGKLFVAGADGDGAGLAEYLFSVARDSVGAMFNPSIELVDQSVSAGFSPSLNATPSGDDLNLINPSPTGDTEICWTLCYHVCTLATHAIPGA